MKTLDLKTLGTIAGGTICAPCCPPCPPPAPVCPPPAPTCGSSKSKKC
ncbi:hypothetical protein [Methylobacterium frigidaeris]|uniref:Uncharacterized protein n=1 Tax=Methylobacterium frigidaeris TaxID=2038277 RepID=A0AA37M2T9_9HYPH|nr:hypothetical protein [Methylobacterium frigidaeris]GJD60652.1 hypothetical protein MPEAHAMD_0791 [Methylobacterium frigidaeris]